MVFTFFLEMPMLPLSENFTFHILNKITIHVYMSWSQFRHVCRHGVIFLNWVSGAHFKASHWFQKQYPGV